MKRPVLVTPAARADLTNLASYLSEHSPPAAKRFLTAVSESLDTLSATPEIGGVVECNNPQLAGLRVWQVKGFEKHLIFYRPLIEAVLVVRVLHGARDILSVLDERS